MSNGDSQTYTVNDDGTIVIKGSDGKEVRYAKESDLLTVKGTAEKERRDLTEAHEAAITAKSAEVETAKTELATVNQSLLQAVAAKEQIEEQAKESAGSKEELAGVKEQLVNAQASVEGLTNKALEYRRTIIANTYGIPVDSLKEKTIVQLDHYEEALKAVVSAKGVGPYAIGGGGGAPATETPMERAKRILAEADAKVGKAPQS